MSDWHGDINRMTPDQHYRHEMEWLESNMQDSKNVEIERKFLVTNDDWLSGPKAKTWTTIIQGYMSVKPAIRVRIRDEGAFITIKGKPIGAKCSEFEYPIPVEDAYEMIQDIEMGLIEKTRYFIPDGKYTWEIDVFHGDNDGLVMAEIELDSEDAEINLDHSWLGQEVTGQEQYYNSKLSILPFKQWKDS